MILADLWLFGVATKALGRDKGRLPGCVVTNTNPAGAATCSARDQPAARAAAPTIAHSARATGLWVCALCTRHSFVTMHYLGSLFGKLFMNIVHRHCSWVTVQKKKNWRPRDLGRHTFDYFVIA